MTAITTPCGLRILSRRARLEHVMSCPIQACANAGADELLAAAAFRRLGAQIDVPTLIALRVLTEELQPCGQGVKNDG